MPINSIGYNAAGNPAFDPSSAKQRQADFKALSTALQNSDMAAAQQAFAQIQKDDPKLAQAIQNQESNPSDGKSQLGNFANLASALQQGDLSGAQTAFAAIKAHRHHGHGRPGTSQPNGAADPDGDNDGSSGSASSTVGTVIDTTA